uniref:Coiled-coil domain-containing protein 83 n=1 Tax=Caenorhabditis tropicalis TaxID=1561998 RepID=A0A1I7TPK5_9PELO
MATLSERTKILEAIDEKLNELLRKTEDEEYTDIFLKASLENNASMTQELIQMRNDKIREKKENEKRPYDLGDTPDEQKAQFEMILHQKDQRIAELEELRDAESERFHSIIGRQEMENESLREELEEKKKELARIEEEKEEIPKTSEQEQIASMKAEISKLWAGIRDLVNDKSFLQFELKQKNLELEKYQKTAEKVEKDAAQGLFEVLKEVLMQDEKVPEVQKTPESSSSPKSSEGENYWHKDYITPSEASELILELDDNDDDDDELMDDDEFWSPPTTKIWNPRPSKK